MDSRLFQSISEFMSSLNYVQDVTLARDLIVNLAETITLFKHSPKAIIDFEIESKNDF